jgi:AraC-like DNA-binding protein
MAGTDIKKPPFSYSCYVTRNREGEQFVPEHVFSYQLSGTLTVCNGSKEYVFREGDFRFIKRNQLLKFVKQPAPGGAFESVSVYFDQDLLKSFSLEYGYNADHGRESGIGPVTELKKDPLYKSFMDSLQPYLKNGRPISPQLQSLKLREALLILLESQPPLASMLFDFQEPGKIDLEEFMNRNFHFNVQLKRFAYLTGRSLATFKRDFEQIFHTSPSKWLLQRRLQEAHYLIKNGKAPADIYLDLGFEDLSHFSFAFKKMYGLPPSRLAG